MEEETKKTPKHSSGVNILIRLDSLWKDTHLHSRAGLFSSWNADLDRIWLELARDIKEKDYTGKKDTFDEFDNDLKDKGKIEDDAEQSFADLDKEKIEIRDEHYKVLMKKQIFLARLENELGKGTTTREEGDDDFD